MVHRVFADFRAGWGLLAIVETLTSEKVPSPSACDRRRNSHRNGMARSKNTIRVILKNPRCTGRQVWNRQRRTEELIDVNDGALGYTTKMRWNEENKWVASDLVHEPLVSDEDFDHVQKLLEVEGGRAVVRGPRMTGRVCPLRSRLHCGLCGRRMQGSWNNQQPYYRCTFASEYATANHVQHPRSLYLREAAVLSVLDDWLARLFETPREVRPRSLCSLTRKRRTRVSRQRTGRPRKGSRSATRSRPAVGPLWRQVPIRRSSASGDGGRHRGPAGQQDGCEL